MHNLSEDLWLFPSNANPDFFRFLRHSVGYDQIWDHEHPGSILRGKMGDLEGFLECDWQLRLLVSGGCNDYPLSA